MTHNQQYLSASILIVLFCICFFPQGVIAQNELSFEYLGGYTSGGETYSVYYYPGYFYYDFYPYYYRSAYYSANKIPVTIGVEGFPSQYSTSLKVDGSSAGTIPGGGTVYVEVNWRVGHTFEVQSYVEGAKGERFYCPANSWYLEKFDRVGRDAKAANTFQYTTEYQLSVSSPYGDATKNSGWYAKGSSVTLSAEKTVEIDQGEREVFDGWNVGGSTTRDSTTTVILDSPREAKAEYHKEFYLQVRSEHGDPSGTGWYKEGSTATVQVDKTVSIDGIAGTLGGKLIFNGWAGEASGGNLADVYMNSPKIITAKWREDYSTPYMIIFILAILMIIVLFLMYRKGMFQTKEKAVKPEKIEREPEAEIDPVAIVKRRYAQGEITEEEYLNMIKNLQKRK